MGHKSLKSLLKAIRDDGRYIYRVYWSYGELFVRLYLKILRVCVYFGAKNYEPTKEL